MNQQLLDRILRSPRLPSLPSIAVEVIELVQRPDVDVRQIAATIQNDPALAGKILKTVNSSFYSQSYAVSTISHALVVLGLNSVKTLALGFSLVNNLKMAGGEGFNHFEFWKRSLYSATAARNVSRAAGLVETEEAFLGGLMQDLGMLALNQALGGEYGCLIRDAGGDHARLLQLERDQLGLDHAEVGAALARNWNLPPLLTAPIQWHESADKAPPDALQPLIRCVALGNRIADVYTTVDPGDALQTCRHVAEAWFGIAPETTEPLLREVHRAANEMRRLFDLPTGDLGNADHLLARANEALLQLSLQSVQQTNQLRRQNEVLVEQAFTDSLTGTANRRRFNEFIADAFPKARPQRPLSVLFLDTDHFKGLNDAHGHPAGDRALVELAGLLQRVMPDDALVARYGGEEFAVVLPNVDRRTAAQLAEQARQQLEARVIRSDSGAELRVTASIGVATYDGECFQRVEQLIKAADQGVYAAKTAGRNCVRIFTPAPQLAA